MTRFYSTVLLGLFSCTILAQQRPDYQLLWRIEGGDDTKTSYLFGTAHIKHPKAFDFSDSVLFAFDKCEVLALEVSVDDQLKVISGQDPETKVNHLKEELNSAQYNQLKERVKQEADVDLENLKVTSPLLIRRLLAERHDEAGEYSLTLDSYLFDVAKGQGKDIVGLEELDGGIRAAAGFKNEMEKEIFVRELLQEDSATAVPGISKDLLSKLEKQWFEVLVEQYYQGDIEKMSARYSQQQNTLVDPYAMRSRNHLMSRKIDSLVKISKTFVAVGAAHLGGEEGIIQLLRDKGYQLTPVAATFTGLADEYKERFEKTGGYLLEKLGEGYRVRLSGKPVKSKMANSNLNLYMYQDLSDHSSSMIFSVETPNFLTDEKELFEHLTERMQQNMGGELMESQHLQHYGCPGYKALVENAQMSALLYFFKKDTRVYIFGEVLTQEQHTEQTGKDFLNRIELFNFESEAADWETLVDEADAFSLDIPGNYNHIRRSVPMEESPEDLAITNDFSAVDAGSQSSFMLSTMQYPLGYYVSKNSEIIDAYEEAIQSGYQAELLQQDTSYLGPYPAFDRVYYNSIQHYYVFHRLLIRGSKIFSVSAMASDSGTADVQRFIDAFQISETDVKADFRSYMDQDSAFTMLLPTQVGEMEESPDYLSELDKIEVLSAADEGFNLLINFYKYDYSEFAHYSSTDSLILSHFEDDTVHQQVYADTFYYQDDGLRAFERLVRDDRVNYLTREKLVVNGQMVYYLQALLAHEFDISVTDSIFNSFTVLKQDTLSLQKRRTRKLLEQLSSRDSATFAHAQEYIRSYSFEPSEIDMLYTSLQRKMPLDTGSNWYGNARTTLVEKFENLHDERTAAFLAEYYDTTTNTEIRRTILTTLSGMDDSEAASLYLRMLPHVGYSIYRLSYFHDTISRVYQNRDLLLSLLGNRHLAQASLNVFSEYLETEPHMADTLMPHKATFVNLYALALDTINLDSMDYSHSAYLNSVLNVITHLGGAREFKKQARQLLKSNHYSTQVRALLELLKIKAKVKKADIRELLANKNEAYELIWALNENGYSDILKKHLKQPDVTEIFVRSELYYYDYYPEEVNLLEVLKTDITEGAIRIYVYSYTTDYDDTPQIAVTAAQPDSEEVNFEEDYVNIWFGEYDAGKFEPVKTQIIDEVQQYFAERKKDEMAMTNTVEN